MPLWLDIETSVPGEVVGRLGSRWRARHAFMDHLGRSCSDPAPVHVIIAMYSSAAERALARDATRRVRV
jgi:hypothetical protein